MSIKDQLRAAILSGGATGASPSGEAVSINCKGTVGEWEAISTFVAPADGFVFVSGETHAGEADGGVAEVSCTTGSTSVHSYGIAKVTVPVRKGETVRIAVKGELGVYAGFIPAKAST